MLINNSETYVKKWTEGSIFCYRRGCNCAGCYMKELINSTSCKMKNAVIELVKRYGKPPESETEKYTKCQLEIFNAIKSGAVTYEAIAQKTNKTEASVRTMLQRLYAIAETEGLIFTNKRKKFGQLIKWIRGNK